MVIDFHTHSKWSKKAAFSLNHFRRMIRSARRNGLTALALTEHYNAPNFPEIYATLDRAFEYKNHYYDVDGFRVFAGMEIDVQEIGHILLIGHREEIASLHRRFAGRAGTGGAPAFDELFDAAEQYNLLKIGAHPTRRSTPLVHLGDARLGRFDGFDLNGKDLVKQKDTRELLTALGSKYDKPVVGGSDAHLPVQIGCVFNRLTDDCRTVDQLRECLQRRRYELVVSPAAAWKVHAACVLKKIAKTFVRFS